MGGMFSSSAPAPVVTVDNSAAEEEKARLELQARNRRGRASMINTSDSGALTPAASANAGKSLLGE